MRRSTVGWPRRNSWSSSQRRLASLASRHNVLESLREIVELAPAMSWLEPLTEFPLRSPIVGTGVLWQLVLHLSKTLQCLRDVTIPFQNVANDAFNEKPRKLELIRKSVTIHIRTIALTESIPWLRHPMLRAPNHEPIPCSPT